MLYLNPVQNTVSSYARYVFLINYMPIWILFANELSDGDIADFERSLFKGACKQSPNTVHCVLISKPNNRIILLSNFQI